MLRMMKIIYKSNKFLVISLLGLALIISLMNGLFSRFGYISPMNTSEFFLLLIIILVFFSMASSYMSNTNGTKKEFFTAIPIKSSIKLLSYLLFTIGFILIIYLMGAVSNLLYHSYYLKRIGIVVPFRDYMISFDNIKGTSSNTFEIADILSFTVYNTWFFLICITGINIYRRMDKKVLYTGLYIFLLVAIFIVNTFIGDMIDSIYKSNVFNHYQPFLALVGLFINQKEWYYSISVHYLPFINAIVSICVLFPINIILMNPSKENNFKFSKAHIHA